VDPIAEHLHQLIQLWMSHAAQWGRTDEEDFFKPVAVPQELLATVTQVEPDRAQVMSDASFWLSTPQSNGLGLEYRLGDFQVTRDEHNRQIIAPLQLSAHWANSMSTFDPNYQQDDYSFARLVHEDGQWKMAALWTAKDREDYHRTMETHKDIVERIRKRT
jgi:hypothetical protein